MRTIHLIWLGATLPPRVGRIRAELAARAPDLEVRLWRDDDLSWLANREWFLRESHLPSRADIARYEILHRHGGLYLDVDFRIHGSLTDVLTAATTHGLVVARQSRATFCNGFLAATPGHPLLTDLVAGIPEAYRRTGRMTAPATTGPHYLTERLIAHLRRGGTALELPQHAVFPWHLDEEPVPDALLPSAVVVSHGWFRPDAEVTAATGPAHPVAPHVSRDERLGRARGGVRARAAARPMVHRLVGTLESLRVRGEFRAGVDGHSMLPPTVALLEQWSARFARRRLAGSANFLDVHPASDTPLVAAGRTVDRTGRAIAIIDGREFGDAWRDASIRGSTHVVTVDQDDEVVLIRTRGSALIPTGLSAANAPLDLCSRPDGIDVGALVASLPRIDLVRFDAARLSGALADVLHRMVLQHRIASLVVTVDPWTTSLGLDRTRDLLGALEHEGLRTRLGPWLVEGHGRTWVQHLRVAARPFLIALTR